jgi:hypothetical protein
MNSYGQCPWHCSPLVGGVNETLWLVSMTLSINIDTSDLLEPTCVRLLFPLKEVQYQYKNHKYMQIVLHYSYNIRKKYSGNSISLLSGVSDNDTKSAISSSNVSGNFILYSEWFSPVYPGQRWSCLMTKTRVE